MEQVSRTRYTLVNGLPVLLKEGNDDGGKDGDGTSVSASRRPRGRRGRMATERARRTRCPWLMVYLYLLKEGDEEVGEDGDGASEQDPLHLC